MPDLIVADRDPYYHALRHSDDAWENGSLGLTDMESLMSSLLAEQLLAIHQQATGKKLPTDS